MSFTKQQSGIILEPIQVGSGLEVPSINVYNGKLGPAAKISTSYLNHVSGYKLEEWKGIKEA